MSFKVKSYKQLDGSLKLQISKVGDGVLRRFDRTPFPTKDTDVICPHFMLLAWANGCPFNCAFCYLKGTFRFHGQNGMGRVPMIFKDRKRIAKGLDAFLDPKIGEHRIKIPPELINTGELSDSLMQEGKDPFSCWIMKKFAGSKHKILFLTKSTNIDNFMKNDWQDNAILSWSINADAVSKRWEHLAPDMLKRLKAARRVSEHGYTVRLRIDPMVPIENWQEHYSKLLDEIFKRFTPERVTLGCLRGLTSTIVNCKDKSWVKYLSERSNWGRKPSFQSRYDMYRMVIDLLEQNGLHKYGICKDTVAIWKALGLEPNKIKCNCIW